MPPRRTLEIAGVAVVLVAAVLPFWAGRFLPFLDLPQHLALSRIIHDYADPTLRYSDYYLVDGRITPYWGYYAAMNVLQTFFSLELANRLLFTAYAAGLPLAAGYLLASLGRDWRWAVFTLPLVWNTNLFYGFTSFVCSLPLFLLALGLAARQLSQAAPSSALSGRLAAACALVYLFHAQSYLLLGLCVLVLFAIHWRSVRWAASRTVPYLLSLALFAPWFWRSFVRPEAKPLEVSHTVRHLNYGSLGGLNLSFEPKADVLAKIPERLVGAYNDGSDWRVGGLLLAAFAAAWLVAGLSLPKGGLRAALRERAGELLCLVLFASYLFAPMEAAGQWYINPRHLVFAALLAPAFLVAPARGFRTAALALALAVGLYASMNARSKVIAFQDQVGPFAEVLEKIEPGKRVANLMFDNGAGGPSRWWPFVHFACYAQALKGGDVSFSFAGLPSIPVAYRPGMQAPHPYEWSPQDFDFATMGASYDYFLARGSLWGRAESIRSGAELVQKSGPWELWKRR